MRLRRVLPYTLFRTGVDFSSLFSSRAVSLWLIGMLGMSLSKVACSDALEPSVVEDADVRDGSWGGESSDFSLDFS